MIVALASIRARVQDSFGASRPRSVAVQPFLPAAKPRQ
jgi:hypothetical protein